MKENPIRSLPGIPVLLALSVVLLFGAYLMFTGVRSDSAGTIGLGLLPVVLASFLLIGLYMVEPNQAAVLTLFGKYIGTVKEQGLRWNNPFFGKKKVSLRVRAAMIALACWRCSIAWAISGA